MKEWATSEKHEKDRDLDTKNAGGFEKSFGALYVSNLFHVGGQVCFPAISLGN